MYWITTVNTVQYLNCACRTEMLTFLVISIASRIYANSANHCSMQIVMVDVKFCSFFTLLFCVLGFEKVNIHPDV